MLFSFWISYILVAIQDVCHRGSTRAAALFKWRQPTISATITPSSSVLTLLSDTINPSPAVLNSLSDTFTPSPAVLTSLSDTCALTITLWPVTLTPSPAFVVVHSTPTVAMPSVKESPLSTSNILPWLSSPPKLMITPVTITTVQQTVVTSSVKAARPGSMASSIIATGHSGDDLRNGITSSVISPPGFAVDTTETTEGASSKFAKRDQLLDMAKRTSERSLAGIIFGRNNTLRFKKAYFGVFDLTLKALHDIPSGLRQMQDLRRVDRRDLIIASKTQKSPVTMLIMVWAALYILTWFLRLVSQTNPLPPVWRKARQAASAFKRLLIAVGLGALWVSVIYPVVGPLVSLFRGPDYVGLQMIGIFLVSIVAFVVVATAFELLILAATVSFLVLVAIELSPQIPHAARTLARHTGQIVFHVILAVLGVLCLPFYCSFKVVCLTASQVGTLRRTLNRLFWESEKPNQNRDRKTAQEVKQKTQDFQKQTRELREARKLTEESEEALNQKVRSRTFSTRPDISARPSQPVRHELPQFRRRFRPAGRADEQKQATAKLTVPQVAHVHSTAENTERKGTQSRAEIRESTPVAPTRQLHQQQATAMPEILVTPTVFAGSSEPVAVPVTVQHATTVPSSAAVPVAVQQATIVPSPAAVPVAVQQETAIPSPAAVVVSSSQPAYQVEQSVSPPIAHGLLQQPIPVPPVQAQASSISGGIPGNTTFLRFDIASQKVYKGVKRPARAPTGSEAPSQRRQIVSPGVDNTDLRRYLFLTRPLLEYQGTPKSSKVFPNPQPSVNSAVTKAATLLPSKAPAISLPKSTSANSRSAAPASGNPPRNSVIGFNVIGNLNTPPSVSTSAVSPSPRAQSLATAIPQSAAPISGNPRRNGGTSFTGFTPSTVTAAPPPAATTGRDPPRNRGVAFALASQSPKSSPSTFVATPAPQASQGFAHSSVGSAMSMPAGPVSTFKMDAPPTGSPVFASSTSNGSRKAGKARVPDASAGPATFASPFASTRQDSSPQVNSPFTRDFQPSNEPEAMDVDQPFVIPSQGVFARRPMQENIVNFGPQAEDPFGSSGQNVFARRPMQESTANFGRQAEDPFGSSGQNVFARRPPMQESTANFGRQDQEQFGSSGKNVFARRSPMQESTANFGSQAQEAFGASGQNVFARRQPMQENTASFGRGAQGSFGSSGQNLFARRPQVERPDHPMGSVDYSSLLKPATLDPAILQRLKGSSSQEVFPKLPLSEELAYFLPKADRPTPTKISGGHPSWLKPGKLDPTIIQRLTGFPTSGIFSSPSMRNDIGAKHRVYEMPESMRVPGGMPSWMRAPRLDPSLPDRIRARIRAANATNTPARSFSSNFSTTTPSSNSASGAEQIFARKSWTS